MSEFVSNPLFGLALSILAYLVGMLIYRRFPHPLTTPLLLSAVFIIIFLSKSYQSPFYMVVINRFAYLRCLRTQLVYNFFHEIARRMFLVYILEIF